MAKQEKPIIYKTGKYVFTQEEIIEKAKANCEKQDKKDAIDSEMASYRSVQKARLEMLDAEMRANNIHIQDGYDMREYPCHMEKDYKNKVKVFTHADTGEFVCEEPMTDEDMQMQLEEAEHK